MRAEILSSRCRALEEQVRDIRANATQIRERQAMVCEELRGIHTGDEFASVMELGEHYIYRIRGQTYKLEPYRYDYFILVPLEGIVEDIRWYDWEVHSYNCELVKDTKHISGQTVTTWYDP